MIMIVIITVIITIVIITFFLIISNPLLSCFIISYSTLLNSVRIIVSVSLSVYLITLSFVCLPVWLFVFSTHFIYVSSYSLISHLHCSHVGYYFTSYRIRSYQIKSNIIISYQILSCHIISNIIISCHIMSCHIMSCHITLCHIILFQVALYCRLVYHITLLYFISSPHTGKKPFFNWISADSEIATARGGGGGLALWQRDLDMQEKEGKKRGTVRVSL